MAVKLNQTAYDHAKRLIASGRFVANPRDDWQGNRPSSLRQKAFIRLHGLDVYGKWHLGVNDAISPQAKRRFEFLFGDFIAVHRCALLVAEARAGYYRYQNIGDAVADLLRMIDAEAPHIHPAASPRRQRPDRVEEASLESFPASDPPSWTPIVGHRMAQPYQAEVLPRRRSATPTSSRDE